MPNKRAYKVNYNEFRNITVEFLREDSKVLYQQSQCYRSPCVHTRLFPAKFFSVSIKVKGQTLPEINVYTRLFGILE